MLMTTTKLVIISLVLVLSCRLANAIKSLDEEENQAGDFLTASTNQYFDLRDTIPGIPGIDYPIYKTIPKTSFSCSGRSEGYYADPETRCQAFRICTHTSRTAQGFAFLCPNGTVFSQKEFVCDWYRHVNCDESENYYDKNQIQSIGNSHQMLEVVRQMMEYPIKSITQALPVSDSSVAVNGGSSAARRELAKAAKTEQTSASEMTEVTEVTFEKAAGNDELNKAKKRKLPLAAKKPELGQFKLTESQTQEVVPNSSLQTQRKMQKFQQQPEETQALSESKQHQQQYLQNKTQTEAQTKLKTSLSSSSSLPSSIQPQTELKLANRSHHHQQIELLRQPLKESRIQSRIQSQPQSHLPSAIKSLVPPSPRASHRHDSALITTPHSASVRQRATITGEGQQLSGADDDNVFVNSLGELSSDLGTNFHKKGSRILAKTEQRRGKSSSFAQEHNLKNNTSGSTETDYIKQQRSTAEGTVTDLAININNLWEDEANGQKQQHTNLARSPKRKNDFATKIASDKQPRSYIYRKPEGTSKRIVDFSPNEINDSLKSSSSSSSSSSSPSSSLSFSSSTQFSSTPEEFYLLHKAINMLIDADENIPSSYETLNATTTTKHLAKDVHLANAITNLDQKRPATLSSFKVGEKIVQDAKEILMLQKNSTKAKKINEEQAENKRIDEETSRDKEKNNALQEKATLNYKEIESVKAGPETFSAGEEKFVELKKIVDVKNEVDGKTNVDAKKVVQEPKKIIEEQKILAKTEKRPKEESNFVEQRKTEHINVTYSFAAPIIVLDKDELRLETTPSSSSKTTGISPEKTQPSSHKAKESIIRTEEKPPAIDTKFIDIAKDATDDGFGDANATIRIDEERLEANERAVNLFLAGLRLGQQEAGLESFSNDINKHNLVTTIEKTTAITTNTVRPTAITTAITTTTTTSIPPKKHAKRRIQLIRNNNSLTIHRRAAHKGSTLIAEASATKIAKIPHSVNASNTTTRTPTTTSVTTVRTSTEMITEISSIQRRRRNHHRFATIQRASMKPSIKVKRNFVRTTTKPLRRKATTTTAATAVTSTTTSTTAKAPQTLNGYQKRLAANRLRLSKFASTKTTATTTTTAATKSRTKNTTPRLTRVLSTTRQPRTSATHQPRITTTTTTTTTPYAPKDDIKKDSRAAATNLVATLDATAKSGGATLESVRQSLQRYQVNHGSTSPNAANWLATLPNKQRESPVATTVKPPIPSLAETPLILNLQQPQQRQYISTLSAPSISSSHPPPPTPSSAVATADLLYPQYVPASSRILSASLPAIPLQASGTAARVNSILPESSSASSSKASSSLSPLSTSSIFPSAISSSLFDSPQDSSSTSLSSIANSISQNFRIQNQNNPRRPSSTTPHRTTDLNQIAASDYGKPIENGYQQLSSTLPLASPVAQQQQHHHHHHHQYHHQSPETLNRHEILIAQAEGQHVEQNLVGQIELPQLQQQQQQQPHVVDSNKVVPYIPLDDFLKDKFSNHQVSTYNNYHQQQQQQLPDPVQPQHNLNYFNNNLIYQQQQQNQQPPQQNLHNRFYNAPTNSYITHIQQGQQQQAPSNDNNLFSRPTRTQFQQQQQQHQQQLYNNLNIFSPYQRQQPQQPLQQQQPELRLSRNFPQQYVNQPPQQQQQQQHQNNLPQQQQQAGSINSINKDLNNNINHQFELLKSINIALPAQPKALLPSLWSSAQRRSDDFGAELNFSIYDGATSYDVPLNSVGPLPNDKTSRPNRLRRRF